MYKCFHQLLSINKNNVTPLTKHVFIREKKEKVTQRDEVVFIEEKVTGQCQCHRS